MSDALQLLCDLSEASDQTFRDNAVEPQWRDSLSVPAGLGAIEPGPPPDTIACSDCDDDHPAPIEYDAERRRFRHSCGEAGFVWIDDARLRTHRFRPEWTVDWLSLHWRLSLRRAGPFLCRSTSGTSVTPYAAVQ